MITQETAERIWNCYREIATGEKLLEDMQEVAKKNTRDDHVPQLRDVFGHRRDLQLGIPSGENGHRLFGVSPTLAKSIIRAHIAAERADLAEANEQARMELEPPQAPV